MKCLFCSDDSDSQICDDCHRALPRQWFFREAREIIAYFLIGCALAIPCAELWYWLKGWLWP